MIRLHQKVHKTKHTMLEIKFSNKTYGTRPKVNDKVKVRSKSNGDRLYTVGSINNRMVHLKNRKGGITVNLDRIDLCPTWRGAKFEYQSIN